MAIKHVVVFQFKPAVSESEIAQFMAALNSFVGTIPGCLDFNWGPYAGPFPGGEGSNKGFTHGFIMTWADRESRASYLPHPLHQDFVKKWLGIVDDLVAFDFEA